MIKLLLILIGQLLRSFLGAAIFYAVLFTVLIVAYLYPNASFVAMVSVGVCVLLFDKSENDK